jgi:hypothetical protein
MNAKEKTLRCLLMTIFATMAFVWSAFGHSYAGVDLRLRQDILFTGQKTTFSSSDRVTQAGGTLTLNKREAVKCDGKYCTFNLGVVVYRDSSDGVLSTYALIRSEQGGIGGNTVIFQAGEQRKGVIYPVALAIGKNKVIAEVDPYKKAAETNETNNTVAITIIVEP